MNTTSTETQTMTLAGVTYTYVGMLEGVGPEFRTAAGEPSFDTSEVFYEGHSQGGIMGIIATAVSTEWTKAVIGVPGIDYALLIPRSNNWQTYGPVIAGGYDRPVDGLLILAMLQQQWDRAEGSGYARYLTGTTLTVNGGRHLK